MKPTTKVLLLKAGGTTVTTTQSPLDNSTKLASTAYADAADLAATAALIEREGLRFDGTAGAVIGGGGAQATRTGGITVAVGVRTPAVFTGSYLFSPTILASGIAMVLDSAGKVNVINAVTAVIWTSTASLASDTDYILCYSRGNLYINGALDSTTTDTADYVNPTGFIGQASDASQKFTGSLFALRIFNYNLTASEIAALTRRGLVTLPEQRGGSMVAMNTSAFTNTSYNTFSGASATGFTASSITDSYLVLGNTFAVKKGFKYRVSFTATITGVTPRFYDNKNLIFTNVVNGLNTVDITSVTSDVAANFLFNSNGTGTLVVSGLSIIPLGTLFEQDSGQRNAGYMVGDSSGNKLDLILPASGVSIIDPAQRGTIRFTTTTSGNQQLGGSQVIIPTNARITSWVINSSGTPNVTLGNVSAGAQYRASAAVVSGDNEITLLTRFTTTGNLWVNSSTTATLKHTIQWEYIQ